MLHLLAALLLALPAAAQSLIHTDFAGTWSPVRGNIRATGELPRGWSDNSSWANSWVNYTRVEEDGRVFLHTTVTRLDDGAAQFLYPLPRLASAGYVRLRLTVRNPDALSVRMGVRRVGSPYNFLWELSRAWPSGWRDYTYYARLEAASYDTVFLVILQSAGRFDLARLDLDSVTLEDIQNDFISSAAPPNRNLVRNSRFPLGLQSGWTIDRESSDGDHVRVSSEGTALRIRASRQAQIYTEPVRLPQPVGRHTASLYVKGKASGALAAISSGSVAATRAFRVDSDEWQRIEVSFTPSLLGLVHGVRIDAAGDLWVDRLQVERSAAATPYEPPAAAEVALAVDSPIRVHFEDEAAIVKYAVTGGSGTVEASVTDLYGRTRTAAAAKGEIRYDLFPDRTFGAFRIEAWVKNEKGERISPFNEIVVQRLRRPRYWMRDAPASPFGTHTLSTLRHILMAKAAGVNWTRLHDAGTAYIGWYHLERKPGEWTVRDEDLWRYRDNYMRILGAFATAPEWASYFDKPRNSYFDRYYQPRDLEPFSTYVRLIAERYYGLIDSWDLWNEPWGHGYFAVSYDEKAGSYVTSANPQRDFARLTRVARESAHKSDPNATILGLNSTTGTTGSSWTRGVAAEGGIEPADVLCYHQYTSDSLGFPGDAVEKGFELAVGPVKASGKPVWMTEGSSINGRIGNGLYRHTLPVEDDEDAVETGDRLVRFVVGLLGQGVKKVFLYSMHTHVWFGLGNTWRTMVNEDGQLHPSAAAHSFMAWLIEDTTFVRRSEIAEGVTAYVFEGAGRTVTAIAPRGLRTIPRTAGLAYYDLYGNPLPQGGISSRHMVYAVAESTAAPSSPGSTAYTPRR